VELISVEIAGIADSNAFIDQFIDRDNETVNKTFTAGNMFCITGNKIKVAGEDPDCGVYFVSADNNAITVKVDRIGENTGTMITGIAPLTKFELTKIEIRTQYTGSNISFLKTPRKIKSGFVINRN
jgi:hypothetical protein